MGEVILRPAVVADVTLILELVNRLAAEGQMLPRSPASVVENLRDFVVAEDDGVFAGCGALSLIWTDIAEIRSIVITPEQRGSGLGMRLANRLMADADQLGVARVMAFTYVVGFFEKLGFHVVDHADLPHKVFNDCLNCPKFHQCDEIAVLKILRETEGQPLTGPMSLPTPGKSLPILGQRN
ncbi:MAG: amino-acid N-acetyltransferase [Planctomycetota bacterium]|jgi:amino-acid N-acetyltransferase